VDANLKDSALDAGTAAGTTNGAVENPSVLTSPADEIEAGHALEQSPVPGEHVHTELLDKYPADQPVTTLDAKDMRSLFRAAYDWLAHNAEQVNRLNVFPVPDGDTGTNMLLTIKAAWNNIARRGDAVTVSDVAEAAAEGAHQGSRGNSGVILGQILRGFSHALRGKQDITATDLADALQQASAAAYEAVPSPVEGTILTVSREISSAAISAAESTTDMRKVMEQVVEGADQAVRRTPEQLPVLKKAGVVDSGGKGLFFVFEGMYRALTGQPVRQDGANEEGENLSLKERRERKGNRVIPPVQWGFDVQFLIEKPNKPLSVIAADIAAMGDCPLVEGDDNIVKVHVHVFDPGIALTYGVTTGFLTDVVVENMDDMAAENQIAGVFEGVSVADLPPAVHVHLDETHIGLVAVSPGAGFAEIFRNFGAHGIVEGGQSMNPSVAELTEAVRKLPAQRVIILPNNSNIMMAAQQAAKALGKEKPPRQVSVVPAKNMPQGVAALTVFDPLAEELDDLKKAMEKQMSEVQAGEVTQAVRTAEVDGLSVQHGDFIGLRNGKLVVRGDSLQEVSLDLLKKMDAAKGSLITIYYGNFVAEAAAQDFAETVRGEYSDLDVELAYGGQPHYHFIVSVE
jgi:DAK2 domain fusion protein YloV